LRKFEVEGEIIECAGTYPSYQPRFFNRDAVTQFSRKLHERIIPKEGHEWGYTKTPMIVPVSIDMSVLKQKFQYYLTIERERNVEQTTSRLMKSISFNTKAVFSRWVKILRNALFCRGKKMPLSFEWASTVYTLRVILILLIILIKKI
jgi:hypothetical protein